jgi:large subunit ribosomal protein L13
MERKYHLFNAENKVLGRLAVEIAGILSGRKKVNFTPHIDGGDFVVVTNSEKFKVTGSKMGNKIYHTFSGYPGGVSSISLEDKMKKDSRKIIIEAVMGMLPKNKLRNEMIKRLFVYKDEKYNHKIDIKH